MVFDICLILLLAVVIPCSGLWMAGYRFGSVAVAVMLALGLAMEITGIGRSYFFEDDWYSYYVAHQWITFAAGLLTTWYALVILRHMLFSKTMPWANKNNKNPESDS